MAGLREYVVSVSEIDEFTSARYTGNPAVDILFDVLCVKSARAGIDVDISVRMTNNIAINAADICVVISNAVDNAFEACERIAEGERRIDISIATDDAYLFFSISNTAQGVLRRKSDRFLTSKDNSAMHGIGLQSIRRIIDKHSGHSNISVENGIFTLSCALKNEKSTD
jgi:sensor histidine kinase YesM